MDRRTSRKETRREIFSDENFLLAEKLRILAARPRAQLCAVSNYEKLNKKPQINGVELIGNKTFEELGMDKAFASKQELQELQKKFDELVDGNEVAY